MVIALEENSSFRISEFENFGGSDFGFQSADLGLRKGRKMGIGKRHFPHFPQHS
jgi:hypothetical protein